MNLQKGYKVFSQTLTALNSIRSLIRTTLDLKKLLTPSKGGTKKESKKDSSKDSSKDSIQQIAKENQLHGALLHLGYTRLQADKAVKELSGRLTSEPLPELIRAALGILNG